MKNEDESEDEYGTLLHNMVQAQLPQRAIPKMRLSRVRTNIYVVTPGRQLLQCMTLKTMNMRYIKLVMAWMTCMRRKCR